MAYRYGYFNEEGTEYIVTDPATPRAFDNFLWNDVLFSNVQQTGVGCCDYQIGDREAVQLLTGNGRVCDFDIFGRDTLMSRLVYVRDNGTGEYWNVNWEPVRKKYERYRCAHGLGYSVISTTVEGIGSEYTIFVPQGSDPVELWKLKTENKSGSPRDLSVFLYNQFQFRYKWGFDSYGDMLFRSSHFNREQNAVVVRKHPHVRPHDYLTAFLTSDEPIAAYDGSREAFVGAYATLAEPRAVVDGRCSDTPGSADATVGAVQYDFTLAPGETKEITLILGVSDGEDAIPRFREKYLTRFDGCLKELAAEKKKMCSRFSVNTPDGHLNRMLNYWIKEQAAFGAAWCRWGWNGYRDIVQHGFGVSSFQPERTREILLEALRYQYRNGLALRGWNPVDTKAYSDSALWLVFTLVQYIRETGDGGVLDRSVPYYDSEEPASVLEHVEQALDFLETHKGVHGLCLIKFGDWNDSLTAVGKAGRGESVWLSEAYAEALRLMAGLSEFLGRPGKAAEYAGRYEAVRAAVNASAWDGEWYLRCFDDDGKAVGSRGDREGSIFSESQGWALISGIADGERAETVLRSCDAFLRTPQGYRLLAPTFTTPDERIGRISYMEPGICENGTIYSHINIWLILGMLRLGKAEESYGAFQRFTAGYVDGEKDQKGLNPPYIYANCYYGPDHRNSAGKMEFTWITGSISWILNVLMDDLLGIFPDYRGLRIRPCIPGSWKHYEVTRFFRGAEYRISVENPEGLSSGRVLLTVDGTRVEGDTLPVFASGVHRVAAVLTE